MLLIIVSGTVDLTRQVEFARPLQPVLSICDLFLQNIQVLALRVLDNIPQEINHLFFHKIRTDHLLVAHEFTINPVAIFVDTPFEIGLSAHTSATCAALQNTCKRVNLACLAVALFWVFVRYLPHILGPVVKLLTDDCRVFAFENLIRRLTPAMATNFIHTYIG